MSTDLLVPNEAVEALCAPPLQAVAAEDQAREIARSVVIAELLALADRLNALTASAGARYQEGSGHCTSRSGS